MLVGMSRPRTRPTRDETRERLLQAAAQVFIDKGIGNTSIEDICDEAGFSRGAFYSNFSAKDELVIAILDAQRLDSGAEMDRMFSTSSDPTDFIDNLESDRRQRTGPLDFDGSALLNLELLLYALRNPDNRSSLVAYHRRHRETNKQILQKIVEAEDREYPLPLGDIAALVMAIDAGVGINKLVDPESNPDDQFSVFMGLIHRLWMAAPPDLFSDDEATTTED